MTGAAHTGRGWRGWRGAGLAWLLAAALAAALAAGLPGCGWQLRGHVPAAESTALEGVRVHVDAPGDLRPGLVDTVRARGATLVGDPGAADLSIRVGDPRLERRVLSVDPATGRVREYELAYSLGYSAYRGDGAVAVAPQRVSLRRDYVFDENAVLGAGREEQVLVEEMRREALQQALRRLAAALSG